MTTTYLSKKETNTLIRKCLKEAFPDLTFSVTSSGTHHSSSVTISWDEGANIDQVQAITNRFKSLKFNGMEDIAIQNYYLMDGQKVDFYSDYITYRRTQSDTTIQNVIDSIYRRFTNNFTVSNLDKPSVESFKSGGLHTVNLDGFPNDSLQRIIRQALAKRSDRMTAKPSATAASIVLSHTSQTAEDAARAVKSAKKQATISSLLH